MSKRTPKYSIILAGGKGTRMRSANLHKVCFPIDGRPAINRALAVYKSCGIPHHIIVVGAMAGQVIETVGKEHEGVIFAYQAEQLGTAHAARQGAQILDALATDEDVLIVAGDRVVEPFVLEQLFDLFYSRNCDMVFLAGPRRRRSNPGRIVLHTDGSVLGDVEALDVWQRQLWRRFYSLAQDGRALPRDEILQIIRQHFSDRQASTAFGELWYTLTVEDRAPSAAEIREWIRPEMTRFTFVDPAGTPLSLTPEQIGDIDLANFSIYLVKTAALHYALARLNRDNAQQEEYLSDIITVLAQERDGAAPRFNVQFLKVERSNYVMAFNDPAELLEIEAYIQSKKRQTMAPELPSSDAFRKIADWQLAFRRLREGTYDSKEALWHKLAEYYGDDVALMQDRAQAYAAVLDYAERLLGQNEAVLLVRSPGRVNVMGRHIDHQGGSCNLMTVGYETLAAIHPRQDDRIRLFNLDREQFPDREFSIGELVADLPWDDWISLVNSEKVSRMALEAGGNWSQYIKAAVLRLQKKFSTMQLRGADIIVAGNIPIAAGLSSSSALVVAAAEAMVAVNQLDTFPSQFIDLCGEGEWFVGTRGGNADHAAIKLGQRSRVVQVKFFDFAVQDIVPFPEDYALAICDSGIKAQKTNNARDQFNHRVACYHIGLKLIRKLFPQYAPLLHHLRDVNTRTLNIPLAWIYKILLRLPEQATRDELRAMLPDESASLESLFATHQPPADGLYPIRGVVLFGLAECERSRLFALALRDRRISEIGRLMNVSHDGDRVVRFTGTGSPQPYQAQTSNGYLLDLIEDLESGDPERVIQAQLQWQPGSYRCSVVEVDRMVDIALRTGGVAGAQLAGAGLGGCMMVLIHKDAIPALAENLNEGYYRPYNKTPSILLSTPIAGSDVLFAPPDSFQINPS